MEVVFPPFYDHVRTAWSFNATSCKWLKQPLKNHFLMWKLIAVYLLRAVKTWSKATAEIFHFQTWLMRTFVKRCKRKRHLSKFKPPKQLKFRSAILYYIDPQIPCGYPNVNNSLCPIEFCNVLLLKMTYEIGNNHEYCFKITYLKIYIYFSAGPTMETKIQLCKSVQS